MKVLPTALPGVLLIEPAVFGDDRGWFMESYHAGRLRDAFAENGTGDPGPFVQDNHSLSMRGVVRGLHYQLPPQAQGKLVRVVRGAVFDVAVDIRRGSPTFGRWVGVELSEANRLQAWIPPGFAHGFAALADGTELLYKCTAPYARDCERSIAWNDPALAIAWPVAPSDARLSPKDAVAPALAAADLFD